MKKIFALFLAFLLMSASLPALAEGAQIRASLPGEIQSFFTKSSFNGYTIERYAAKAFENTVGGSFYFVVASKGSNHTLYGFEKKNGAWQYWLKSDSVLPQLEGEYQIYNARGLNDFITNDVITADQLCMVLILPGMDYYEHSVSFRVDKYGQWRLHSLCSYALEEGNYTEALVYSDHIAYYDETQLIGIAWGVVETNLRYCSAAAFPATYAEAKNVLSNPPDIPYGSELTATKINFTGGQKYPVYSGPGTDYERAAGGKATVSTNDWIQVFGRENGYILIQYDITSDQMRFGYIEESALPKSASVSLLSLDYEDAVVTGDTYLTDDPLESQTRIRTISQGQQGVKWLAKMGNWVYVEVTGSGKPIRGFVPEGKIQRGSALKVYGGSYQFADYTADVHVTVDGSRQIIATIQVNAEASWLDGGSNPITGYQLYANNLLINTQVSVQKIEGDPAWRYVFQLTGSLPANTGMIGFCPVYGKMANANEMMAFFLN
ncbi:MAG: hypothetical protein PUE61_07705 [Clostridiales bacterium]|nr:hypothetical protein [Clostridiales bacterium]